MFTRTSSILALALLAGGCEQPAAPAHQNTVSAPIPEKHVPVGAGVACARGGDALAPICSVDRTPTQDGVILTLRHPDGGFRRLKITGDGRGVVAADGAEAAKVRIAGSNEIDVTLGEDHYRLPATIGAARAP